MNGTAHFALVGEILAALGDDIVDDQGLVSAMERLGGASRVFGRKELEHLRFALRVSEDVVQIGQGRYRQKLGIVVLTTERLFFLEKSLGSRTLEEFDLSSISSLSVGKRIGGELLRVSVAAGCAEIDHLPSGQGEAMAEAIRRMTKAEVSPNPSMARTSPRADVLTQIERLGELRDRGLLSEGEFQQKKVELLDRM